MADYTRSTVGRAAAILTTGEVAGASIPLNGVHDSQLSVGIDFTVGSLTNCTFRYYGSVDGTVWDLIYIGGVVSSTVLTATDTIAVVMPPLSGYKFFRASAQGSGTVTSSSATISYRWLRRGSQI